MILSFWQEKVRPALDKHPGIVLGIVGAAAIAAAVFGVRSWTNGGPALATFSNYFTTDDGKTLFEDNDPHDIPPFDHDGHEAVRAFFIPGQKVGRTDSIWYLTKMTDEHKKQMEAMSANGPGAVPVPKGGGGKMQSLMSGQLVKRPGDAEWIPLGDSRSAEILKLP